MKTATRKARAEVFVLCSLIGRERSGRDLRKALKRKGLKTSLAGFYSIISRLENSNSISCRHEHKKVFGIAVIERFYRIAS